MKQITRCAGFEREEGEEGKVKKRVGGVRRSGGEEEGRRGE